MLEGGEADPAQEEAEQEPLERRVNNAIREAEELLAKIE